MPISAKSVAELLIDTLRRSPNKAITLSWPTMYEICERERFKGQFLDNIKNEVEQQHFAMSYDRNTICIRVDADIFPIDL